MVALIKSKLDSIYMINFILLYLYKMQPSYFLPIYMHLPNLDFEKQISNKNIFKVLKKFILLIKKNKNDKILDLTKKFIEKIDISDQILSSEKNFDFFIEKSLENSNFFIFQQFFYKFQKTASNEKISNFFCFMGKYLMKIEKNQIEISTWKLQIFLQILKILVLKNIQYQINYKPFDVEEIITPFEVFLHSTQNYVFFFNILLIIKFRKYAIIMMKNFIQVEPNFFALSLIFFLSKSGLILIKCKYYLN